MNLAGSLRAQVSARLGRSRSALSRPHPLARAALVDRLDRWIGGAWHRGWLNTISLDPEVLITHAQRGYTAQDEEFGRSAEDIADFRARLPLLCRALEEEANLNSLGRAFAYGQLVRAIRQRFALGAIWRKRPEMLNTEIAPPIIVVGQMRSGTTRIHRLLAADPAHSATRFCDSWHPVPQSPDWRPLRGGFNLFMARRLDPWLDSLHPFGAARADEELGWLAAALCHNPYEAQWRIPSYVAFGETRDAAPIYREFVRLLRTDAAQHGNAGLPRILKIPQFSEDLRALLAQFPNARLVVSRRCDRETLRSSVSLVSNQMVIQSNSVDLATIETEWQRKLALRTKRIDSALADHDGPVAEVHFDALGRNWGVEIARIYHELGLDLTDAARGAMAREMQVGKSGPHLAHASQMEQFDAA